jgi:hypothetical protein
MNLKFFINLATVCLLVGVAIFFASKSCERAEDKHAAQQVQQKANALPQDYSQKWIDDPALDYSSKDIEKIELTAASGGFKGWFRAPKNWATMMIEKSQNQGDWVSLWCDGRNAPSRIYHSYEKSFDQRDIDYCFDREDQSMTFRFQGRGTITLHRLSMK